MKKKDCNVKTVKIQQQKYLREKEHMVKKRNGGTKMYLRRQQEDSKGKIFTFTSRTENKSKVILKRKRKL